VLDIVVDYGDSVGGGNEADGGARDAHDRRRVDKTSSTAAMLNVAEACPARIVTRAGICAFSLSLLSSDTTSGVPVSVLRVIVPVAACAPSLSLKLS